MAPDDPRSRRDFLRQAGNGFGALDVSQTVRSAIPAALGIVLGFLTIMFSMFAGILTIPTRGGATAARPLARAGDVELVPVVTAGAHPDERLA